ADQRREKPGSFWLELFVSAGSIRQPPVAAMLLEMRARANPSMPNGSGLKVSGTSLVANATHTRAARMAQSVLSRAGSPPAIAAIGPRPFLESPPPAASP